MGVVPYLVATSLVGVVAQRLLRVLCPQCKKKAVPTERDKVIMRIFDQHMDEVYHPVGCPQCLGRGYSGRMAVHEILAVSDQMTRSIVSGAPVEVLREQGAQFGYRPMQEDAFERVKSGLTTFEEARRLIFFSGSSEDEEDLRRAS
jgi:type IV pilus assembly protein PilB